MDAHEYEAAGLLDPGSPEVAGRFALLEHFSSLGISLEQMRSAAEIGSLHAVGSDRAIRPGPAISIEEVSAAAGVDVEMLRRVLVAAGVALDDGDFRSADVATFQLFAYAAELFGPEATLRFIRAMGSALGQIADAAIAIFLVEVEDPMVRGGGVDELARALATEGAVAQLVELPTVMDGLFRMHVEQAITRQRASSAESLGPGMFRLAVGFVDLVGFTPLARDLAPADLAELVENFEMTANEIVATAGGRVVKHMGDEVMFVAVDAAAGARIARELVARFEERRGVAPHAGVAFGAVLGRGGDYYGSVVNTASRIADIAVPGEILVTDDLVRAATGEVDLTFASAGRRLLKGFDEPLALWSLT
jgi:adenylate cyclase